MTTPFNVTHPSPVVSDRYQFFPTNQVINFMESNGFEVSRTMQLGKRSKAPEYGQHLVTFRKKGQQPVLNEGYPELIFLNSHNRSRAARFLEGFFRGVCSNGLVFGSFQQDTGRIQHYNNPFDKLMDVIAAGVDSIDRKIGRIIDMKERVLDDQEYLEFLNRASELRPVNSSTQLGFVERREDYGRDLWKVYNRTQEHLMKGNYENVTAKGKLRKARPLSNIGKTVEVNTKLWEIAESYM